jgi:hypothetical protein
MEQHAKEAWELEGTVDEEGRLSFGGSLPLRGPRRVRVIVLTEDAADEADFTEEEWLTAAARNPAFGFLEDPAEDLYGPEDGKPFRDEG